MTSPSLILIFLTILLPLAFSSRSPSLRSSFQISQIPRQLQGCQISCTSQLLDNSVCDQECNTEACGYDNGHCTVAETDTSSDEDELGLTQQPLSFCIISVGVLVLSILLGTQSGRKSALLTYLALSGVIELASWIAVLAYVADSNSRGRRLLNLNDSYAVAAFVPLLIVLFTHLVLNLGFIMKYETDVLRRDSRLKHMVMRSWISNFIIILSILTSIKVLKLMYSKLFKLESLSADHDRKPQLNGFFVQCFVVYFVVIYLPILAILVYVLSVYSENSLAWAFALDALIITVLNQVVYTLEEVSLYRRMQFGQVVAQTNSYNPETKEIDNLDNMETARYRKEVSFMDDETRNYIQPVAMKSKDVSDQNLIYTGDNEQIYIRKSGKQERLQSYEDEEAGSKSSGEKLSRQSEPATPKNAKISKRLRFEFKHLEEDIESDKISIEKIGSDDKEVVTGLLVYEKMRSVEDLNDIPAEVRYAEVESLIVDIEKNAGNPQNGIEDSKDEAFIRIEPEESPIDERAKGSDLFHRAEPEESPRADHSALTSQSVFSEVPMIYPALSPHHQSQSHPKYSEIAEASLKSLPQDEGVFVRLEPDENSDHLYKNPKSDLAVSARIEPESYPDLSVKSISHSEAGYVRTDNESPGDSVKSLHHFVRSEESGHPEPAISMPQPEKIVAINAKELSEDEPGEVNMSSYQDRASDELSQSSGFQSSRLIEQPIQSDSPRQSEYIDYTRSKIVSDSQDDLPSSVSQFVKSAPHLQLQSDMDQSRIDPQEFPKTDLFVASVSETVIQHEIYKHQYEESKHSEDSRQADFSSNFHGSVNTDQPDPLATSSHVDTSKLEESKHSLASRLIDTSRFEDSKQYDQYSIPTHEDEVQEISSSKIPDIRHPSQIATPRHVVVSEKGLIDADLYEISNLPEFYVTKSATPISQSSHSTPGLKREPSMLHIPENQLVYEEQAEILETPQKEVLHTEVIESPQSEFLEILPGDIVRANTKPRTEINSYSVNSPTAVILPEDSSYESERLKSPEQNVFPTTVENEEDFDIKHATVDTHDKECIIALHYASGNYVRIKQTFIGALRIDPATGRALYSEGSIEHYSLNSLHIDTADVHYANLEDDGESVLIRRRFYGASIEPITQSDGFSSVISSISSPLKANPTMTRSQTVANLLKKPQKKAKLNVSPKPNTNTDEKIYGAYNVPYERKISRKDPAKFNSLTFESSFSPFALNQTPKASETISTKYAMNKPVDDKSLEFVRKRQL